MRARRIYTPEFRLKAIALSKELGTTKAASKLGISRSRLTIWRQKSGDAIPRKQPDRAQYATREEQDRAVAIAAKLGVMAASRELGIPPERLYRWRSRRKGGVRRDPISLARNGSSPNPLWLAGFRAGVREGLSIAKEPI